MQGKALPGFRDFYPEDLTLRNHIFATWRSVATRYGFEEYDGPPLESLEMYTKKSGDEIVAQLYTFKDKGDREVALRPEMTPTLARMVAARVQALKKPIRWFSIPQLFRYERQQRGRLREHFQLNMDIIGEASPLADAELMAAAVDIMRAFGLGPKDVQLRVSDRRVIRALLLGRGVTENQLPTAFAVIDRSERVPRNVLEEMLKEAGYGKTESAAVFDVAALRGKDALKAAGDAAEPLAEAVRGGGPLDVGAMRIPYRPFDGVHRHAVEGPDCGGQVDVCFGLAGEINEGPKRISLALDIFPPLVHARPVGLEERGVFFVLKDAVIWKQRQFFVGVIQFLPKLVETRDPVGVLQIPGDLLVFGLVAGIAGNVGSRFQEAEELHAVERSFVWLAQQPFRRPKTPEGRLAIEIYEVVAVIDDVVHDAPGRLCNALLEGLIRQQIESDAEDEKVADDFIGAGVALPIVLLIGGPVPLTAMGHRVAFANVGARGEAAAPGHFLEEKNGFHRFAGIGERFR